MLSSPTILPINFVVVVMLPIPCDDKYLFENCATHLSAKKECAPDGDAPPLRKQLHFAAEKNRL